MSLPKVLVNVPIDEDSYEFRYMKDVNVLKQRKKSAAEALAKEMEKEVKKQILAENKRKQLEFLKSICPNV